MYHSTKDLNSKSLAVFIGSCVVAIAISGAVSAQQTPPPVPGDGPGPRAMERGPMGGAPDWLRGLDLTREQREKVYTLLEPVRAERQQQARERFVDGPAGGDGIRDLIVSGKLTKRDAVRIATERADKLKQQLIKDAEVMGAIYEDVLTAEQRQTLQDGMKRAQEDRGDRFQRRRQMRGGDAAFRQGPAVLRDEFAPPRGRPGSPPDLL